MAANLDNLANQVRDLHCHLPGDQAGGKPVVVLLHGLGGDADDWHSPFQSRNWPFDHRQGPVTRDLGVHHRPPVAGLPGVRRRDYLSPRLAGNADGREGSDDRSWWHALVGAGFPVLTYSQRGGLLVPFHRGPVAQFAGFMEILQRDVLVEPGLSGRQVVIVGHSRGGLIGRAYLGLDEVKEDTAGRFPPVSGLITISSPHQGSHMALLDDRIAAFLDRVQKTIPLLPKDVTASLKKRIKDYVGAEGNEVEPGSALYDALQEQEPISPNIRCITVGGTSPRLLRLYVWLFTPGSLLPHRSAEGGVEFHWRARPLEVKVASPIPDGLPLRLLRLHLDELVAGRGDGLTADRCCRLPASFETVAHLSVPLSHAEELWDPGLQAQIIEYLERFQ